MDPKTSTTPIIDGFDNDSFRYNNGIHGKYGTSSFFDWDFNYIWLPRRKQDLVHPEQPAPLPIMYV